MLDLGVQLAALAAAAEVMAVTWMLSVRLRDASLADVAWGLCFVAIAVACCLVGPGAGDRSTLLLVLVAAWGLRLAIYIGWRHDGEDRRYAAMRKRYGDGFTLRSLWSVFGLQAVVAWFVSLETGIGAEGEPLVAGEDWRSTTAARAVSAAAPGTHLVSTADAPVGLRWDLSPVLILTTSLVAELGVDFRRLRPNVLIDGAEGREEAGWVGSTLRLGSARLAVTSRCERCVMTTFDPDTILQDASVLKRINEDFDRLFGLHCEVIEPGEAKRGDAIVLEPAD